MDAMENINVRDISATVFVFVIAILGLVLFFTRFKNLPPGPVSPLTILTFGKESFLKLTQLSKDYGPIFSFRVGTSIFVVLNDITVIKAALVEQAEVFSNRVTRPIMDVVNNGTKGSILFGSGENWKEMRRFGSHAMRTFGVGKRSIVKMISEETFPLISEFLAQEGKAFNPNDVINNAVSNIICSLSFGERYEYDDIEFQFLLSSLQKLATLLSGLSMVEVPFFFLHFLVHIPPFTKMVDIFKSIQRFVSSKVKEHSATLDPNDVRDVIDLYLLEADKQSTSDKSINYDVNGTWRFVRDLFAAGSDTTSNSLMWAIALLCHYPQVQEKVFEEIKSVVGVDRFPAYDDKGNLPYTEAVILEIQRFRPAIPLLARQSIRDTTLSGYFVPKGSKILINIWATGHDPLAWKDPYDFVPERFLSPDGKRVCHNDSHIPFGIGRRICLGEPLAKMEIFVFFSSLAQRFRFKVPEGHPLPPLVGKHGITFCIDPYVVCAEPRI